MLTSSLLTATPAHAPDGARTRSGSQVTTFWTIEGRQALNIGAPASSAGDTTITRGSVSMTCGGPAIGTFATRVIVVMPDANGRERRDTTVHVSMAPAAASVLRLTWNLMPNIGFDPEQATTIAFERLVNATSSGQATNDFNTLSQGGSQGRLRMKGEDGRFTCGDAKFARAPPGHRSSPTSSWAAPAPMRESAARP